VLLYNNNEQNFYDGNNKNIKIEFRRFKTNLVFSFYVQKSHKIIFQISEEDLKKKTVLKYQYLNLSKYNIILRRDDLINNS